MKYKSIKEAKKFLEELCDKIKFIESESNSYYSFSFTLGNFRINIINEWNDESCISIFINEHATYTLATNEFLIYNIIVFLVENSNTSNDFIKNVR